MLILAFFTLTTANLLNKSINPIILETDVSIRVKAAMKYFQEFCFLQSQLDTNQHYDIKVSYLGSVNSIDFKKK